MKKGKIKKDRLLLTLLALPFALFEIAFAYVPLAGWALAFTNYKPGKSFSSVRFVGLKYFALIGYYGPEILNALLNTLFFSVARLVTMILPVAFAICLNEIRGAGRRRFIQTAVTLPHFVSWIIVYSLCFSIFSTNGLLNTCLFSLRLIDAPTQILANATTPRLQMVFLQLWKSLGWSSIVYLAAIAGIDAELYEAARVDGAGRFVCATRITLPGLLPTFFVLLLLSVGDIVSVGFDEFYLFSNAFNATRLEVLDLFTYRKGLGTQDYSFATAVGMIKSLVSVTLLLAVNGLSKKLRGEAIL